MEDVHMILGAVSDVVLNRRLPSPDVLKLIISKLLGYAILAGACITKIPQVLAVTGARSAEGLSPLSIELETFGLLVHAAYGWVRTLPFSMYGETVILAVQNVLLLLLVYHYGKAPLQRAGAVTALLAGLVGAVFSGTVPTPWVHRAFDANNLVLVASRVPQIVSNQLSRSTGQLSTVTSCINLLGVCVRIFTTISEKGGPALLRTYLISLVLNATLVAQIFMFRSSSSSSRHMPRSASVRAEVLRRQQTKTKSRRD